MSLPNYENVEKSKILYILTHPNAEPIRKLQQHYSEKLPQVITFRIIKGSGHQPGKEGATTVNKGRPPGSV